ncbi:MAG: AMP-binding protein [Anaerolineales bacterium]|nr:AMP-binding protein [Anaerolineales bacterium]
MPDLRWSYVSGSTDQPLLGLTIGEAFDRTATRFPDHEALVVRHQALRYTYAQLREAVNRFARGLMALGLQKGERVGIWAPNRAEWTITQLATAKIGAILVTINPAYRLHELEYALNQSGCVMLVMAPQFRTGNYVEMLQTLCPELTRSLPGQLAAQRIPQMRSVVLLDGPQGTQRIDGTWSWSDVLERAGEVPPAELAVRQTELQFDDPINVQYTSGTTGNPKGATLSHHNIVNNAWFVGQIQGFTEQDRLCAPVPLYHCFGCVLAHLACFVHGATVVFPAESFDPATTLQLVQDERCTALYGVPTMFIAELDLPNFDHYDLTSLRTGLIGGAPCPIEVMRKIIDRMHMHEVEIIYGMTETSPISFQSRRDDSIERRVATVGRVHPHVEVKIVDPASGRIVPTGQPGELCTRGYSVMLEYWENAAATRHAIDSARWMHTGDLATMDADGYVKIVGRLKDMVIRGGENVYPREIEEFLYRHPKISDVYVIGVPDVKYGEELVAWVRLKPDQKVTAEELREYCRGEIATYKIPRYWKFVSEFPMTVTGKIQKFAMRRQSIEELGLLQAAAVQTA